MSESERTFVCYICGERKPAAEQAKPCGYTKRYGQTVCLTCCEECSKEEPFPCPEYVTRQRRERKKEDKR